MIVVVPQESKQMQAAAFTLLSCELAQLKAEAEKERQMLQKAIQELNGEEPQGRKPVFGLTEEAALKEAIICFYTRTINGAIEKNDSVFNFWVSVVAHFFQSDRYVIDSAAIIIPKPEPGAQMAAQR